MVENFTSRTFEIDLAVGNLGLNLTELEAIIFTKLSKFLIKIGRGAKLSLKFGTQFDRVRGGNLHEIIENLD